MDSSGSPSLDIPGILHGHHRLRPYYFPDHILLASVPPPKPPSIVLYREYAQRSERSARLTKLERASDDAIIVYKHFGQLNVKEVIHAIMEGSERKVLKTGDEDPILERYRLPHSFQSRISRNTAAGRDHSATLIGLHPAGLKHDSSRQLTIPIPDPADMQ
jgi:hypothetical protein